MRTRKMALACALLGALYGMAFFRNQRKTALRAEAIRALQAAAVIHYYDNSTPTNWKDFSSRRPGF